MHRQTTKRRSLGTLAFLALVLQATATAGAAESAKEPKSKDTSAQKAAISRGQIRRVSVDIDRDKFGEGWKQDIPLTVTPGDAYVVWVKDGWLHVKRHNGQGDLDWQIVLAKVVGPEPPKIEVIEGAPVFELSYAGGRYFIRESSEALRCVRQRKKKAEYLPAREILADRIESSKAWGRSRMPDVMLSDWRDDEWCYVASGLDQQRLDAVVRLNPLAKQSPGYGVRTMFGGYVYYFHGRTWLMDDGELLVALRTLESNYKAELARDKIRKNLSGGTPPEIVATQWLNTDGELPWSQLEGKVVLLDFWGTWCGPCVKKLPDVQRLHERFADRGLVVIGVHSNQGGETCPEFVEERNITYPIAIDSGKTAEAYAISAWPTVFVIDKTGKVVVGYTHDVPSDEVIENLLDN